LYLLEENKMVEMRFELEVQLTSPALENKSYWIRGSSDTVL